MFHLADVFQFVVNRFDDGSFTEHNFVVHGHQAVFHVVTDTGDQVYVVHEQDVRQFFGDISFVCKELSKYRFQKDFVLKRFPVVYVGLGNGKVQYFALVVDHDMQLKAIKPAHGRFAHFGYTFEYLVSLDPLVMANPDRGGIYKRDACTGAKTAGFQKDGHRHKHFLAEFSKPVIRHRFRKLALHVPPDIEQIKVFETPKPTQMKKQTDSNNLAFGHRNRTFGRLAQDKRPGCFIKIFAELIHKTKNIANFIVVNHMDLYLNI